MRDWTLTRSLKNLNFGFCWYSAQVKKLQAIILPASYFPVGMIFFFGNQCLVSFMPDTLGGKPSALGSIFSQNFGGVSRCFEMSLCYFSPVVALKPYHGFPLPFTNNELNRDKRGLQCFRRLSEPFSDIQCALEVILVGWPLLIRITIISCFQHFVVHWSFRKHISDVFLNFEFTEASFFYIIITML